MPELADDEVLDWLEADKAIRHAQDVILPALDDLYAKLDAIGLEYPETNVLWDALGRAAKIVDGSITDYVRSGGEVA